MNFNRGVLRLGMVAQIVLMVLLALGRIYEVGWDKIAPEWELFVGIIIVFPALIAWTGVGFVIVGNRAFWWIVNGFRGE